MTRRGCGEVERMRFEGTAGTVATEYLMAAVNAAIPPLHGALLKNEQDVHLFERLRSWPGGRGG